METSYDMNDFTRDIAKLTELTQVLNDETKDTKEAKEIFRLVPIILRRLFNMCYEIQLKTKDRISEL